MIPCCLSVSGKPLAFKGDVEHSDFSLEMKWLKSILEFDDLLDFAGIWGGGGGGEAGDMTGAGT